MTWYIANFKDRGAQVNSQSFYIEGDSEEQLKELAQEKASNDMDPDTLVLESMGDLDIEEIYEKLYSIGGLNEAYTKDGERITRSDVDSSDF